MPKKEFDFDDDMLYLVHNGTIMDFFPLYDPINAYDKTSQAIYIRRVLEDLHNLKDLPFYKAVFIHHLLATGKDAHSHND